MDASQLVEQGASVVVVRVQPEVVCAKQIKEEQRLNVGNVVLRRPLCSQVPRAITDTHTNKQ